MTPSSIQRRPAHQRWVLIGIGTAVALGIAMGLIGGLAQRRQAIVAERAERVMPFDLDLTTHYFTPLPDGGLQAVRAKRANNVEQIALIRAHLRHEAAAFRRGDFGDPAAIHGEEMPGLAELRAGASAVEVRYSELPDGAQIRYTTADPQLVEALHRWFQAQLRDHGRHARPGEAD